ncbi:MAG TPA: aspartate aminotransferase family protein [Pirellulales bacterium]|nr:aspartate aminotransferase family protein [Pirellulales bacterium]
MNFADSPIVAAYRRRTPNSAKLAERAADVFPGGVTHDGRMLQPYPIYVERAAGSRKWDVDGHEYVDYMGGHGALLLGHNHPAVVAAVEPQLRLGTHYGSSHELEVRWGEMVRQLLPSAERVRFTSSGTEATMMALRLARAFTGAPKVMRFQGHFHGWHDHAAFGVSSHFDGTPTPGVLDDVARQVVLAPPGDVAATRDLLDRHGDIAAVIIEPTGASWGQVPVLKEFLVALRELTAERGVLLIFDEVISGFRCSPGGAQGVYGIRPDLTTLAKILAGGFPGGAVVGRKDILDALDPEAAAASGREKVPHQGTFNANPISAAAGVATLGIVADSDVCQRASDYAARLREELARVLRDERVPWAVYGTFSGFHIFTNPKHLSITAADIEAGRCDYRVLKTAVPSSLSTKLRLGMLLHGVEIFSWLGGPTSAVHGPEDLEITVNAFRQTLRLLRAEGEIP